MNVRRVTLMVDPLEMAPAGDPFQLGSLYDIDTMLELGGQLPSELRELLCLGSSSFFRPLSLFPIPAC